MTTIFDRDILLLVFNGHGGQNAEDFSCEANGWESLPGIHPGALGMKWKLRVDSNVEVRPSGWSLLSDSLDFSGFEENSSSGEGTGHVVSSMKRTAKLKVSENCAYDVHTCLSVYLLYMQYEYIIYFWFAFNFIPTSLIKELLVCFLFILPALLSAVHKGWGQMLHFFAASFLFLCRCFRTSEDACTDLSGMSHCKPNMATSGVYRV